MTAQNLRFRYDSSSKTKEIFEVIKMTTIVIADDHELVRESSKHTLNIQFAKVAKMVSEDKQKVSKPG